MLDRKSQGPIMTCPDCARLAAEADRIRKEYQAALIRLHAALNRLTRSTLKFQKLKADADDLAKEYERARLELENHRRTHLNVPC
jgi:hypothetical protein